MAARFLLFTNGGGSVDPLNWDMHEAAMYHIDDLKGMKPSSSRSLDLFFETINGTEIVTLGIKNSKHVLVMNAITKALESTQPVIHVADMDHDRVVNKNIVSVSIYAQETFIQVLSNNSLTQINVPRSNYNKLLIANTHSSDITITLKLHDGSTYYELLNTVTVPVGTTLALDRDEISFDNSTYDLYAQSSSALGKFTLTFNY